MNNVSSESPRKQDTTTVLPHHRMSIGLRIGKGNLCGAGMDCSGNEGINDRILKCLFCDRRLTL